MMYYVFFPLIQEYVKQKLASTTAHGTRGPNALDVISASYLDIAILRCLFCLGWQEEGIYWALRWEKKYIYTYTLKGNFIKQVSQLFNWFSYAEFFPLQLSHQFFPLIVLHVEIGIMSWWNLLGSKVLSLLCWCKCCTEIWEEMLNQFLWSCDTIYRT